MRSQTARRKVSATDRRILQTLLLSSVFEPGAIGERIAKARGLAGLRQEDLADLLNVGTRTVQNYEAGSTSAHKHLRLIAELTNVRLPWLLHGDEPAQGDRDDDRLTALQTQVSEIREMLDRVLEARDEPDDTTSRPQSSEAVRPLQDP